MAKPAAKPKQVPVFEELVEVFDDVEQNTPEWDALRCGVITASNFGKVMASGKDGGDSKGRAQYMRRLAGEILTGVPAENFRNAATDRGHDMEPEARELYARKRFAKVHRVGFVRRTIQRPHGPPLVVGCSPDALVDDDGAAEIKTMIPDLMIALLQRGANVAPTEHRAQIFGTMWVTGRKYVDLKLFYRGMPVAPEYRFERDEGYITEIRNEVEKFDYELRQMVVWLRKFGGNP